MPSDELDRAGEIILLVVLIAALLALGVLYVTR